MNLETIADSRLVQDLGWTLLDSVWQIAAISLLLYVFLALFRRSSSNFRYLLCVSALVLSFLIPAITFISRTQSKAGTVSVTQSSNFKTGVLDRENADDSVSGPVGRASPGSSRSGSEIVSASIDTLREYLPVSLPIAVALWLFGVAISTFRLLGGL